jgi:hypothetical protein
MNSIYLQTAFEDPMQIAWQTSAVYDILVYSWVVFTLQRTFQYEFMKNKFKLSSTAGIVYDPMLFLHTIGIHNVRLHRTTGVVWMHSGICDSVGLWQQTLYEPCYISLRIFSSTMQLQVGGRVHLGEHWVGNFGKDFCTGDVSCHLWLSRFIDLIKCIGFYGICNGFCSYERKSMVKVNIKLRNASILF